jgi:hypothetical protein
MDSDVDSDDIDFDDMDFDDIDKKPPSVLDLRSLLNVETA